MGATASGNVAQNSLAGGSYLYTDSGTGYSGVTSRILTIYDANGNVVSIAGNPYSMGANLTQQISNLPDGTYTFICVVSDANGQWTASVVFVAMGFYTATFLQRTSTSGCGCSGDSSNLDDGENELAAAQRFAVGGDLVASNNCVLGANKYVNNTY